MNKRWLILCILGVMMGMGVSAQQENATDSVLRQFRIEEVTVSAHPLEKDVIIPQRLQGAELERMNALSVADAIRYFSGVQLKDYGGVGGIKTINVRSMGSQHTGVFYNGVQLGNAQNGQVDLGKFSLDNVEEIALYNGQRSDIFQSAREFGTGGSIYLTTRRPRFKEGERVHAKAQMRAGSFALVNPSVGLDVKITDAISATMNAELVSSNGQYKFRYRRLTPAGDVAYDTTAVRQNGDINAIRVEAALNDYYSATGFIKIHLYHYNSERGVPGAIVNNVWRNGERLWDRNSFVQGSWTDEFFNRWSIKANAKYANDYTHYINNDDKLLHVENEYLQQELYFTVANKVEIYNWWDLSLAYDFQWNRLTKYADAIRYSHWLSFATAFNIQNYLRIQASLLGTFTDDISPKQQRKHDTRFTPALFFSYRPSQRFDLRLNAFYKQSYRYPTFNDLYYTDMGNALLKPELARQHNVGIAYNLPFFLHHAGKPYAGRFSLNVDAYYNKVQDKIVAYPKGQQFRWTMLNLGMVDIRGVDATAQLQFSLPLDFSLTGKVQYTYQHAIDITDPSDTYYRNQIPYIPWHSGSAILMFGWKRYVLNYSFVYVGERYSQQENIRYNYVQPWYTHDLSLSGSWKIRKIMLKACLEVNNLLGQDYDVIQNYPMPKRNYRCTIAVQY
ncbi:MAG: TonB-dependent receptor [Paludibacter sp.]|nr:TonB-dependent receptor [Bacteroidales bacterium]MCM1068615.1 TonB-dependent receptor [Prevotella sp.]MCM1353279.1 TonB-dependent receptor [Bacteroides sp.]MCM1442313.1 TonB-dependent receptor [Muribaculum sp.]MCM1481132.1 TonB-dependent receptor [Paludibacter sp.]